MTSRTTTDWTSAWTPEEQAEHRKLWIEALRSGKYAQAKGALKQNANQRTLDENRDTKYCCLGVACDISGMGQWHSTQNTFLAPGEILWQSSHLPGPIADWLGIQTADASFEINETGEIDIPMKFVLNITVLPLKTSLTILNDNQFTFDQIAAIIEQEPAGLLQEHANHDDQNLDT